MTVHLAVKKVVDNFFDWLRFGSVLQRPRNGPRCQETRVFQPQTFTIGFSHKRGTAAYICRGKKWKWPFVVRNRAMPSWPPASHSIPVMNAVKGSISPNGTRVSFPTNCLVRNERTSFLSKRMNPFFKLRKFTRGARCPRYEPATVF